MRNDILDGIGFLFFCLCIYVALCFSPQIEAAIIEMKGEHHERY